MSESQVPRWLSAATAIVALIVLFDVSRRSFQAPGPESKVHDAPAVDSAPPPSPLPPPAAGAGSLPGAVEPPRAGGPSYMEQVARAETRRQIRASAGRTYLNEIVAASGDSMLHRWDDRSVRAVRVYVPATSRVANFQPEFVDAVRAAFREWEAVRLPVQFDVAADSASAEVRLRWRVQFEEDRTGQTDLEWDQDGHVLSADITIATFDAEGRPMPAEGVRVVALHEIGHVLGLDHSPDAADLMHSVAKAQQLSRRDTETAQLLYRLTPGSLR